MLKFYNSFNYNGFLFNKIILYIFYIYSMFICLSTNISIFDWKNGFWMKKFWLKNIDLFLYSMYSYIKIWIHSPNFSSNNVSMQVLEAY